MDKSKYYTPHINAAPEDFAKTVLMPGDPLRAKFVAENFLKNAVLVNNVRGIQGYTGLYKGERVSVMASGMGMPSIGIYSYELYKFFGVENIIRIGSAGALSLDVSVNEIIIGERAVTDGNFSEQLGIGRVREVCAGESLVALAKEKAKAMSIPTESGTILSTDSFYSTTENPYAKWIEAGTLGVEMEAAALYMTAKLHKKNALAICTVSDHLLTGEAIDARARQTTFTDMITLSLEIAIAK